MTLLFRGAWEPEVNLDRIAPFDIELDSEHDILDDDSFHMLRRLAWSGLVGLICLAPPCKEFSRLKLRPGGPRALRTPEHMGGISAREVDDSALIHDRARVF